jgi:hypothetical protein
MTDWVGRFAAVHPGSDRGQSRPLRIGIDGGFQPGNTDVCGTQTPCRCDTILPFIKRI